MLIGGFVNKKTLPRLAVLSYQIPIKLIILNVFAMLARQGPISKCHSCDGTRDHTRITHALFVSN